MSFKEIPSGDNIPNDIYAVIEIPAHSSPVKYEVNKDFNALMVDRFMATPMYYPANYGFINKTLADDGDPLDVLVITPHSVVPGTIIHCRPIGMLNMSDESGRDEKVIAVPQDKLCTNYHSVKEYSDLPEMLIKQIEHFFENYKDLEQGKWVKIENWEGAEAARATISKYVAAYKE